MRASGLQCPSELCAACFRFVAIRVCYVARGALLCLRICSSAHGIHCFAAFWLLQQLLAKACSRAIADRTRDKLQPRRLQATAALRRSASELRSASALCTQTQQSRSSCAVAAHSQHASDASTMHAARRILQHTTTRRRFSKFAFVGAPGKMASTMLAPLQDTTIENETPSVSFYDVSCAVAKRVAEKYPSLTRSLSTSVSMERTSSCCARSPRTATRSSPI